MCILFQDRPVDLKKEFPDTHLDMTGSHGQQLFDLEIGKNHGILFLPEPLVLHAEQYAKQKQVEGTFEAQEARKWGMSLDEFREQMQIIAEMEMKQSLIRGNDQQEETSVAGVGTVDDHVYRIHRQQRQEKQRKDHKLENKPELGVIKTNLIEENFLMSLSILRFIVVIPCLCVGLENK